MNQHRTADGGINTSRVKQSAATPNLVLAFVVI